MNNEAKSTTKQILQYIKDARFVQPWQLANEFGYTQHGAEIKISILHKRGLINNSIRGKWTLTNEGERRLDYYGRKDKETNSIRE